jgi:hypothetical protein
VKIREDESHLFFVGFIFPFPRFKTFAFQANCICMSCILNTRLPCKALGVGILFAGSTSTLKCIANLLQGIAGRSNIEQGISNAEVFKRIGQCFSLRYSAVPCSAVLQFKINDFQ